MNRASEEYGGSAIVSSLLDPASLIPINKSISVHLLRIIIRNSKLQQHESNK